jgi:hypothetical protein
MEREEFKKILIEKDYPYEEIGERILVGLHRGDIDLSGLKSIPSGIVFRNMGGVHLNSIEEIPSGVVFMNGLYVYLKHLRRIDPSVRFFGYSAPLSPLWGKGEPFEFPIFIFGIPGIEDRIILNKMIALGLFDR